MTTRKRLPRLTLILMLFLALCAGMFSPRPQAVEAQPLGASALDVIISEVAWGGTAVNSSYEWIELYNTTASPINLSGWNLAASDVTPSISLSGTIPAFGYFLLETNNAAVSPLADLLYSGTLSNTNETLTLWDGNVGASNVIDTANVGCGSCWYAGSGSPDYLTMQRVGTLADGPSAWVSGAGTPRNSQIDLSLSMNFVSSTGTTPPYDVTFSIILTNEGYGTAFNIEVDDDLVVSPNLAFVSATASVGSYNSTTGIWSVPSLASGTSANLIITATMNGVGPDTVSAIITKSEITTGINALDPDGFDNNDSIKIGSSRLEITNIVNNPTPNVGSNVVFTINVSNPTGSDASGVFVDAKLPPGLSFVSASSPAYANNTGVWNVSSLASGASASLTITAQVLNIGIMSLIADVSSVEFANNSAIATITPVASTQADLRLTQTWTRSTSAADTAILQITLNNQDVSAATNVQVRSLLPSGLTYVSHTFSASGMSYNSGSGIWSVGTILGNSSVSLFITVRVAASGTSTTNFAEIWLSDQFDPDSTPGNGDVGEDDSFSVEVLIADLSLTQTSDISGSNAVFTIRVTNSGPDDATNVKVKNSRLSNPANYTYISHSASVGSYNISTGEWTIGSLPEGATVTLVVTTTVVSIDENHSEISDVTEVDADSLPNNNSRTEDDDAATPAANLSLTTTVSNINPEVGSNIIFTIQIYNAGFATATGVEVKDLLPAGLTYVSHTSGQTYNSSTGIWSVGTIPNGGSRSIAITARVASYGIRTNAAEVWKSDQADPNSDPGDGSNTEDDDDSVTIVTRRAILINEVAWAGTGAGALAEDEWIELYNPSDTSITISGWTIRKNSCIGPVYITFDSGKSIARDSYFLLERGSTNSDDTSVTGVTANQIYTIAVPPLQDGGETLYLCDNSGNILDSANAEGFGNPTNPWPAGIATSPYGSMERQGNSAERDNVWVTNRGGTRNGTNASGGAINGTPGRRNSTGNSTALTATPAATATPVPTRIVIPPRPIINEILARPGYDWNQDGATDVFDEFIEIKNLTAIDISLGGWKLDKFVPAGQPAEFYSLPDVTLRPNERIVIYSKQSNLLLSDGGETLRLVDASGKIYDAFTYEIARVEDQSFCRLPDGTPGQSWFEDCIPTPNLSNTREGRSPTSPDGAESPVCNLPDTIPLDFFIPECNGYGANIWNPFYWDFTSWIDKLWIPQTIEKWRTFIE